MTATTTDRPTGMLSESTVHALADTLAREFMTREGMGPIELGAGLNGSFVLAIKYNDTTYELTVTIPSQAGGVYVFSLTEATGTGKPSDIASFKYKDQSDWLVAAGLPEPITFGGITIEKLALSFSQGTVTS